MCATPSHVRLLDSDDAINAALARSRDSHPSNAIPIRWVEIAGKAYGFTPDSVYFGILASGHPYYPYHDITLTTIHDDNLNNYLLGDTDHLAEYLRSVGQ